LGTPQYATIHQGGRIDRGANIELAGVDRRLHAADIDLAKPAREWRVPKAALGQPPMERHLATLEALDPHARARGLALAAAAAGLAAAGADATPDAMALLARTGPVGEFVEVHHCILVSSFLFNCLSPHHLRHLADHSAV